jgi:hypothetical protein
MSGLIHGEEAQARTSSVPDEDRRIAEHQRS